MALPLLKQEATGERTTQLYRVGDEFELGQVAYLSGDRINSLQLGDVSFDKVLGLWVAHNHSVLMAGDKDFYFDMTKQEKFNRLDVPQSPSGLVMRVFGLVPTQERHLFEGLDGEHTESIEERFVDPYQVALVLPNGTKRYNNVPEITVNFK